MNASPLGPTGPTGPCGPVSPIGPSLPLIDIGSDQSYNNLPFWNKLVEDHQ